MPPQNWGLMQTFLQGLLPGTGTHTWPRGHRMLHTHLDARFSRVDAEAEATAARTRGKNEARVSFMAVARKMCIKGVDANDCYQRKALADNNQRPNLYTRPNSVFLGQGTHPCSIRATTATVCCVNDQTGQFERRR